MYGHIPEGRSNGEEKKTERILGGLGVSGRGAFCHS